MLVISSENDPVSIHKMSGASVDGFISKRLTGVNMLGEAIRTVMGGEKFYSRDVCEIICRIYAENGNKAKIFTPQEEKVIELCRQGLNSRKIGERLCISHRTVDNHKNNIFRKLGINSTTELIRYATAKND